MTNSRSIWALALMVQNRFHDPHDTSGQAWWACKHLAETRRLFTVEDEACRKLIGFLPYNARARARILMNMVQYSFAFACLFPMVVFESISRAHRVNVKTTIYIYIRLSTRWWDLSRDHIHFIFSFAAMAYASSGMFREWPGTISRSDYLQRLYSS